MTYGVVFLSGAGLGGWIWDGVVKKLDAPSTVADYSSVRTNKDASLDDYVRAAADSANQLNADKIIIVAHSIGGVVGSELVKQLGERAGGFVGVSAVVPAPGGNFFSCLPFPQKCIMPIIVSLSGTKPPESAIRSGLANGLDESTTDKIISSFTPEAKGLYTGKTTRQKLPDIPYSYIRTTDDRELPLAIQDSAIKRLPNPSVHDIKTGHLPMLTNASEVANGIKQHLCRLSQV